MTKGKDKSVALTSDMYGQKRRGRPPKADAMTNAQRQAKYRKGRVLRVVGDRMAATVAELAELNDMTESEVTTHLIRFALCNKNWKREGFPGR